MAWDIGADFPPLPTLSYAGGLPGIDATLPELSFAGADEGSVLTGTLGELAYANTIVGNYANIRNSSLPALSFSGLLGYEVWVEGELPNLCSFSTGGLAISSSFAAPNFEGELKREICFTLDKVLSELVFSSQTGSLLSGMLPFPDFLGAVTLENRWSFSEKLPQLQYSINQSIVYSSSIVAKVSPISFVGEYKADQIWALDKELPALLGSFEMEAQTGFTLDEKLAVLEYSGNIIGDPYYDIIGALPQLNALGRITLDVDTSGLITSSDGIIRHRRWG